MDYDFQILLLRAKEKEADAIANIISMYGPLLQKHSIVDGAVDDDLHQELFAVLMKCIEKIRYF